MVVEELYSSAMDAHEVSAFGVNWWTKVSQRVSNAQAGRLHNHAARDEIMHYNKQLLRSSRLVR